MQIGYRQTYDLPGLLFYLLLDLVRDAKAGKITVDTLKDDVSKTYNVQIFCKFIIIIIFFALHAMQCLVININSYHNCHHRSRPHYCPCFAYLAVINVIITTTTIIIALDMWQRELTRTHKTQMSHINMNFSQILIVQTIGQLLTLESVVQV